MKNVVAYIRVSTDGQIGEDKFGLDSQRAQIIEYCDKNDYNIVKWYSDEGESGAKYRDGFDSIIYDSEVTNPPYEAVVVAKSDRVARDINIYFYYQGALLKKGVELISISEDFGQFGVFANALRAFTLTCAEMERRNINGRCSGGRKVKASKGGYAGGRPPFGYRVVNHNLEIEPKEAEIVKAIFRMKDDEGKTYKEIVEELNAQGLTNRSGTQYSVSTVDVIYKNKKTYQGYYRYGKTDEWVEGAQEAIIKRGEGDCE